MTLDKARQLLQVQVEFGGGYNRNGARLIMAEVLREHGPTAANQLISEMRLDEIFGFSPSPASSRQ
jgi:hypothetical protein